MNKITTMFDKISDKATEWIGSTTSIIFHTICFVAIFVLYLFGINFNAILLILTTLVSLEAIYLSIFIQRAVNKQRVQLADVEESLEDVEESLEDVEESIEEDDRDDEKVDSKIQKQLQLIIKELQAKHHNHK